MHDGRLTATARLVFYEILDHVNRVSGDAWPSEQRISDRLGFDERTVRRARSPGPTQRTAACVPILPRTQGSPAVGTPDGAGGRQAGSTSRNRQEGASGHGAAPPRTPRNCRRLMLGFAPRKGIVSVQTSVLIGQNRRLLHMRAWLIPLWVVSRHAGSRNPRTSGSAQTRGFFGKWPLLSGSQRSRRALVIPVRAQFQL